MYMNQNLQSLNQGPDNLGSQDLDSNINLNYQNSPILSKYLENYQDPQRIKINTLIQT